MEIVLYKKQGCKLCESAKEKLALFEIPFEVKDIEALASHHEGWHENGSVEAAAAYAYAGGHLPIVMIDGMPYSYSAAMRELKKRQHIEKAAAGAEASKGAAQ